MGSNPTHRPMGIGREGQWSIMIEYNALGSNVANFKLSHVTKEECLHFMGFVTTESTDEQVINLRDLIVIRGHVLSCEYGPGNRFKLEDGSPLDATLELKVLPTLQNGWS